MAVGEKEHEGTVVESGGEKNDSAVVLSASGEKKTTKRKGLFSRLWNAIFRVRGDDFEKRLKNISKEEATVRNRMKRRSITRRNFIRNLIAFSVFFEVIAVSYAIMTTRDEDLDWKLRSFRILPMFLLPAVAFLLYSSLVGFWRMCDRRDQHTLEKLQAEMLGKINELKERTNYYITQQLIQRYDPDPAAKAAAATVLASKLGAESGLKVFVGDESQLEPTAGKNNAKHSGGLRNRKQTNTRGNSAETTPIHHSDNESNHSGTSERITGTEQNQQMVFEHYNPQEYAAHDGSWISRIAALLVGEDPSQSYALICGNCRMHNGLARKEDFPYITYYCPHCRALNKPKHSEEHSLIAPADTLPKVSLKPMESEVINSSSSTSERGNSPIPLLHTPEIVEEVPETAENETPN
ncbi:Lunapark domain [Arabidopsis suecica]|jgi:phage FluMu protein Com|uniref:Uncharacterized protein At2g24330 n=4 Tax=Arabidopsis TaxID=3701 RepID=Y2433_ARATH|nr:integral membrane metal-binding family protein (DUF2296) [Arabidopsis thaliana]Q9ZQ34.1 RecName: Full=Uncharacterized protein At2g24330 [Arabidopsis thaliana]KAG7641891.1 Lunapark domain [Arabidopsis suecica]AAD18106.1 unknown protein [Arabidopsis thaliana]AAP04110.1 unknown protein [Arabidopsis thaliana]AEC07563.1 integral membrane metal-binding family protein (DUF2296) [Arabidopsis thaliana]CAA0370773.1 unnamed protein product [Arabidopsis thaliana]|eukprot:NP_180010.1 integral membrane metal-binding family protein (DUF2296) [Arabidopsis thaliana]